MKKNIVLILLVVLVMIINGCVQPPLQLVCGNDIIDMGETRENCCEDVGCDEDEYCSNNECIKIQTPKKCTIPEEKLEITSDTILCRGNYTLSDGLVINGQDSIQLDCDESKLILESNSNKCENIKKGINIVNSKKIDIKNCILDSYCIGIYLDNSEEVKISDNTFEHSNFGVKLQNSQNNIITNNFFNENGFASIGSYGGFPDRAAVNIIEDNIIQKSDYGIDLNIGIGKFSGKHIIRNNVIRGNAWGLEINYEADNTEVVNNQILNNLIGMSVYNSKNHQIVNNVIGGSSAVGVSIQNSDNSLYKNNTIQNNEVGIDVDSHSEHNIFILNRFENNGKNADDKGGNNYWSDENLKRGNYWDDWQSPDSDGDGIVDEPRDVVSAGAVDYYPLVSKRTVYKLVSLEDLSPRNILIDDEIGEYFQIDVIPTDPLLKEQWAHTKIGNFFGMTDDKVEDFVTVAVIDTGVDLEHPDLKNNLWINDDEIPDNDIDDDNNGYIDDIHGYDFVDLSGEDLEKCTDVDCVDEDPNPQDYHGHGTHVSGIIAAEANDIGVIGICPTRCKIMALRAGFLVGEISGYIKDDDAVDAINYAVDNGADIISMSFGDEYPNLNIENALINAKEKGILLVAAAGNTPIDQPHYPAAYDGVIGVVSTDKTDKKSWFSTYGDWVSVSAPGLNIMSTYFDRNNPNPHSYKYSSGTSMATPLVSGLLGLMKSYYPSKSSDELTELLKKTAEPVLLENKNVLARNKMGEGRINSWDPFISRHDLIKVSVIDFNYKELTGSINNIIEFGEDIELAFTIKNFGDSLTGLEIIVSPSIIREYDKKCITNINYNFDQPFNLDSNEKKQLSLTFRVDKECSDYFEDKISFDFISSAKGGGWWDKYITLPINAKISSVPGWPKFTGILSFETPVPFDLNEDGNEEIILSLGLDQALDARAYNGNRLEGFYYPFIHSGYILHFSPVFGHFFSGDELSMALPLRITPPAEKHKIVFLKTNGELIKEINHTQGVYYWAIASNFMGDYLDDLVVLNPKDEDSLLKIVFIDPVTEEIKTRRFSPGGYGNIEHFVASIKLKDEEYESLVFPEATTGGDKINIIDSDFNILKSKVLENQRIEGFLIEKNADRYNFFIVHSAEDGNEVYLSKYELYEDFNYQFTTTLGNNLKFSEMVLGDIDSDNKAEAFLAFRDAESKHLIVYLVDDNGNIFENYPVDLGDDAIKVRPTIADVNNDMIPDIIYTTYNGFVKAIDIYGNEIDEFEIDVGATIVSSPVVGDFNKDGKLDLTLTSWGEDWHLFTTPINYNPSTVEWNLDRFDIFRRNVYYKK